MFEDLDSEEILAYSVIGGVTLAGVFVVAACVVHVATMDPSVLKEYEAKSGYESAESSGALFGATMSLSPAPGR